MFKRVGLLCVCLLLPHAAEAGTIVTWIGEGEVTRNYQQHPNQVVPPVGTPLTLSMTFNPTQAIPTPNAPPPWNDGRCQMVSVSASVNLGGHVYSGSNNLGFTNAALPGTNCTGSLLTQFSLHNVDTPPGAPWDLNDGGVLILSYRDLLVQDAFPAAPSTGLASFWWDNLLGASFGFGGRLQLQAVEQPTAVPEPGTMTLFGLGLAVVARRLKSRNATSGDGQGQLTIRS
jgi:hypothetical protein